MEFLFIKSTSGNIIFAKAGVSCLFESLVQGSSSVFQMNICAKNPRLRKYEKRWQKILTSVVGKSLADRKLNLARKLKKRLAF